ncbi:MAG: hypothetical protein AAGE65_07815 [Planctomycetota bacterium]
MAKPEFFRDINDPGEREQRWARWFASRAPTVKPPRGPFIERWLIDAPPDSALLLIETVQASSWLPITYEAVALRSAAYRPPHHAKLHPLLASDEPLVYVSPAAWEIVADKTHEIYATPPTDAFGDSTNVHLIFLSFWDGRAWSIHMRHFPVRYVEWFDDVDEFPEDTVAYLHENPHIDDERYADSLRERPLVELILFLRSHAQIRRHLPSLTLDFDWRLSPVDRFESLWSDSE